MNTKLKRKTVSKAETLEALRDNYTLYHLTAAKTIKLFPTFESFRENCVDAVAAYQDEYQRHLMPGVRMLAGLYEDIKADALAD